MTDKFMGFRAKPPLYDGIKAMADQRGMSLSDYLRMMASLELINLRPEAFQPIEQELKDRLADLQEFAELDRERQVGLLHRNIEALTKAKRAMDEAFRTTFALLSALDAYTTRVRPRRAPLDG